MACRKYLVCCVPAPIKARVQQHLRQRGVSESAWLRQLVRAAIGEEVFAPAAPQPKPRTRLVRLRLCPEDLALLRARAGEREMAVATYVAVLVRAHLRHLNPLPRAELVELKRTLTLLTAVTHALHDAHAPVADSAASSSVARDLRALLEVCTQLRTHVKGLLKVNLTSWACRDD